MRTTGKMKTETQTNPFPAPGANLLRLIAPPPREERPKTSHHASSLAGCPRKEYYRWISAPKTNPPDETAIRKMEAGNDAHDLFAMRLGRKVQDLQTEVPVELLDSKLAYPIHGLIDAEFRLEGNIYVVEYKSTSYRFTDRMLQAPDVSHLFQIWAYVKMEPVDHYYLIYEDRGSKLGCQYEIIEREEQLYYRRNDETSWLPTHLSWDAAIEKLAMIEQAVGDETPPRKFDPLTKEEYIAYLSKDGRKLQQTKTTHDGKEKEVMRSHWLCMGYCSYRDYCWLGVSEDAEVISEEEI